MDGQIRPIAAIAEAHLPAHAKSVAAPALKRNRNEIDAVSSVKRALRDARAPKVKKFVDGKLRNVPALSKATVSSLRAAVIDCAVQATAAEPIDTDRRLHSFIAKLSGTMEGLGEREMDAALWNLMSTYRQPTVDEKRAADWWNDASATTRAFWLSEAAEQTPYAAWAAFQRAVVKATEK